MDNKNLKRSSTQTSFFFEEWTLVEAQQEAARLERSMSWVMQRAWKAACEEIRSLPSQADDVL